MRFERIYIYLSGLTFLGIFKCPASRNGESHLPDLARYTLFKKEASPFEGSNHFFACW